MAISGRMMIVDTSTLKSTFPPTKEDCNNLTNVTIQLMAANSSPIRCYRTRTLEMSIMGCSYTWPLFITDVSYPLLGADFLAHHRLLVDITSPARASLTQEHGDPNLSPPAWAYPPCPSLPLTVMPTSCESCLTFSHRNSAIRLICQENTAYITTVQLRPPPSHANFRRLPPQKLCDAKNAFDDIDQMGICKKAASSWASPRHMVKIPDGTWRPCGDYRCLNLITTPNHYSLPNMQDLTTALHRATMFMAMDLLKSYIQVPVHRTTS
ncbi:uncharacterized protein [Palaemon carinicauda]|uniref:uncharacterized protein n=1 Tax=Palaemon carinicauda TaxID=392227 RepID=UPI0035B674B7